MKKQFVVFFCNFCFILRRKFSTSLLNQNIGINVFNLVFNEKFLGIKSQPLIEVSTDAKIKNILNERNFRVMTDYRIKTRLEINQLV